MSAGQPRLQVSVKTNFTNGVGSALQGVSDPSPFSQFYFTLDGLIGPTGPLMVFG